MARVARLTVFGLGVAGVLPPLAFTARPGELGVVGGVPIAIALTGRARPALVITVHNAPPDGRGVRFVHEMLERICARRGDLVLCASADLVARMRARGAADAEQFDVPAGPAQPVSAAEAAAVRGEICSDGRPVVLAVGRLAAQKGLDVLIAAAARWQDRDPQPVTLIAGDGPLASALAAQARQAGGDVRLLGPRHDVPALLEAGIIVALGLVMLAIAVWEFSQTE